MDWKQKLSSRKLWAALAGVAVGLVVAFGGEAETIKTVAGSVMSVVSAIIYILAEAGVDKASAASTEVHILPEDKDDA
nr:MAG TPA: holin [Caudoviricetes sp.]